MKRKHSRRSDLNRHENTASYHDVKEIDNSKAVDMSDPFITHFVESLEHLEAAAPNTPPSIEQFQRLVTTTRTQEHQRLWRDVVLFLVVALSIAGIWLLGMRFTPKLFVDFLVAASILSVIGTPVGLVIRRSRGARSL